MTPVLLSVACILMTMWSAEAGPVVETQDGKVEGLSRGQVEAFYGIPFAAPPTGENRFRPPQPVKNYGYKKAVHKPPTCHQLDMVRGVYHGDEDCLYLNVYRPAGLSTTSKLPVLVYIHGGAFVFGSGHDQIPPLHDGLFDGKNIAERYDQIIVTMNYRLYALGFLALPEIAAENNGTSGNQGLQDQRAALEWVQRNIHAFGGDPEKVTLSGESAGAMSVGCHLVSPASKGLFRSAIVDSGDLRAHYYWYPGLDEAYKTSGELATKLGCPAGNNRLACLRKLPQSHITIPFGVWVHDWVPELLNNHGIPVPLPKDVPSLASPGYPATPFGPTIDGSPLGLPDAPMKLLSKGEFEKVPLFMGTNSHGGSWLGLLTPLAYGGFPVLDGPSNVKNMARWLFANEDDRANFEAIYSGNVPEPPGFFLESERIRIDRVFRDSFFQCSTRDIATEVSRHGVPVYHYVFDFNHYGFIDKALEVGASHAFDLPFVFRTDINALSGVFTLGEQTKKWWQMADLLSCTWASFVKCQKPKCESDPPQHCEVPYQVLPEWIPFSAPDNRNYMQLNYNKAELLPIQPSAPLIANFAGDDKCDFWANAHYKWNDPHDFWRNKHESKDELPVDLTPLLDKVMDKAASIIV